jgi:CubicO group peptidase (beta-lactamase class C family)
MGRGDPRRRSDTEVSVRAAVVAFGFLALAGVAALDSAAAQSAKMLPPTVEAYGIVFDEWVKRRNPATAILVVRRGGKTVFVKGQGVDPLAPTLVASLSKAVTGACVATLVRDGKLNFTTPLREALAHFFQQFGAPADERLGQATIEELLVHRAGLRGNADDDPIYGIFSRRADSGAGSLAEAKPVLGEYLLKERLARIPGGRYSYSNTGYEILTAIVEEQTGHSYEDYCREAVFGKLGIAEPKLHPDWRMLSGAGGWFIPGPDYLAFLDIFDAAHPFLGDAVKAWIDQAQTKWTPTNRTGRWYSLGVNTWAGTGRWTVSHGGVLNARGKNAQGQPTGGFVVSHAFRAADGTAVFIARNWTADAQESLDELRQEIGDTHKVVKTLP